MRYGRKVGRELPLWASSQQKREFGRLHAIERLVGRALHRCCVAPMSNIDAPVEKPTTTRDVFRSLFLASTLFLGFVGFANLLHWLSCGYWCNMLLGSGRR